MASSKGGLFTAPGGVPHLSLTRLPPPSLRACQVGWVHWVAEALQRLSQPSPAPKLDACRQCGASLQDMAAQVAAERRWLPADGSA